MTWERLDERTLERVFAEALVAPGAWERVRQAVWAAGLAILGASAQRGSAARLTRVAGAR